MPSYLYECSEHGELEATHKISEVLETCPKCDEEKKKSKGFKRLISSGGSFILSGGSWAKDGYK